MQRLLIVKSEGACKARSISFCRFALTMAVASMFVVASPAADNTAYLRNGNEHWVGTWSAALHEPDLGVPGLANTGFNNQTLRQIAHTSVGGRQVRVRLSTFGAGRLTIG